MVFGSTPVYGIAISKKSGKIELTRLPGLLPWAGAAKPYPATT